ncbi:MAG: hypothetical protein RL557_189 [archaeon]|jgi:hypothetical protein
MNIEKLIARYGTGQDYRFLTPLQKQFLLHFKIAHHTDATGKKTVGPLLVINDTRPPLLVLQDVCHTFVSTLNSHSYAVRRMSQYQSILGDNFVQLSDAEDCYRFSLRDQSLVEVLFQVVQEPLPDERKPSPYTR